VLTDNLAQARATDKLICATPPPNFIVTGSTSVDVDNLMAARATDKTMHPPPGSILAPCSPDVEIGGPTGGATLGSDPASGAALAACQAAGGGRTSGSTQQSYQNCGVESCRQIINRANGTNVSEDQLLNQSMNNGDADNERHRADSGGTSPDQRQNILANNGVPSTEQPATMANIQQAVAEKKGVISSHDAGRLWGNPNVSGGHAIVVTGIQYDANGNPVTVFTNDTGLGQCQRGVPAGQFQASLRPGRPLNVTNNPIW
jgi:hypothetical protein